MNTRAAVVTSAAVVAVLVVATSASRTERPAADVEGVAVVDQPATPPPAIRRQKPPSAVAAARRALTWQLAEEHGDHHKIPKGVFTAQLEAELTGRPPRPAPNGSRANLIRLVELKTESGVRRVVASVKRGGRVDYVNVVLHCADRCLVAGIQ